MSAEKPRYPALDVLRGLCVLSMVCYHAMYDLVYLRGVPVSWFPNTPGYLWQQSICWTFILLSGACWRLSRRHWQRGLLLLGCGAAVTLATYFVMPSELIQYGVLTLLGLSALLLVPLHRFFQKTRCPAALGLAVSLLLFLLLRNVPRGSLGFERLVVCPLPDWLYQSDLAAVLGFPSPSFYSSDYFPLVPWFFLYLTGYFLWGLLAGREKAERCLRAPLPYCRPLALVGRHSLLVYLLHQPVLAGLFLLPNLF